MPNLTNNDELLELIQKVQPKIESQEGTSNWVTRLNALFTKVQGASLEERSSLAFHQMLWEDNAISGVGMGTVRLEGALEDEEFRSWIAEYSLKAPPSDTQEKAEFYQAFLDGIVSRIKKHANRTPWVKIFRVIAAFFPQDFTTITNRWDVGNLHKKIFGKKKSGNYVLHHIRITEKITELLGECENTPEALSKRIPIAWMIYAELNEESEEVSFTEEISPGEYVLKPLPAIQRRKGLTSIKGGLGSILNAISFVGEGVQKEELIDHLKSEFPDYKASSINTMFNILKNEFFVIKQEDNQIVLTKTGEDLIETSDPEALIPAVISRVLGTDNILVKLKTEGSVNIQDLYELLREVNPGWTTNFAPSALIKWLRDFGLVSVDQQGTHSLTDLGSEWADRIDWEPEVLVKEESPDEITMPLSSITGLNPSDIDINAIAKIITSKYAFDDKLIASLHFGLWAHTRRHFAIMSGLSGSGKTLLAKSYANELAAQFEGTRKQNTFTLAVQPGWYDPSALFGYVNPLSPDSYVRPPMLDFILAAVQNPQKPYVLILDEMNLSHPEQYLAPILSAMESGEDLIFHNEGDIFDGVPSRVPYPSNLAIIGTVNMDETTHGISDKVLDRAFTLEFWKINLADYPNWDRAVLSKDEVSKVRRCLTELMDALSPVRLHFGWRTVDDVLDYLDLCKAQGRAENIESVLDDVLYARILPKLRGTDSERLTDALKATKDIFSEHNLENCKRKTSDLIADLAEHGTMRFWR